MSTQSTTTTNNNNNNTLSKKHFQCLSFSLWFLFVYQERWDIKMNETIVTMMMAMKTWQQSSKWLLERLQSLYMLLDHLTKWLHHLVFCSGCNVRHQSYLLLPSLSTPVWVVCWREMRGREQARPPLPSCSIMQRISCDERNSPRLVKPLTKRVTLSRQCCRQVHQLLAPLISRPFQPPLPWLSADLISVLADARPLQSALCPWTTR